MGKSYWSEPIDFVACSANTGSSSSLVQQFLATAVERRRRTSSNVSGPSLFCCTKYLGHLGVNRPCYIIGAVCDHRCCCSTTTTDIRLQPSRSAWPTPTAHVRRNASRSLGSAAATRIPASTTGSTACRSTWSRQPEFHDITTTRPVSVATGPVACSIRRSSRRYHEVPTKSSARWTSNGALNRIRHQLVWFRIWSTTSAV